MKRWRKLPFVSKRWPSDCQRTKLPEGSLVQPSHQDEILVVNVSAKPLVRGLGRIDMSENITCLLADFRFGRYERGWWWSYRRRGCWTTHHGSTLCSSFQRWETTGPQRFNIWKHNLGPSPVMLGAPITAAFNETSGKPVCGGQNRYFKPQRELFQTLTNQLHQSIFRNGYMTSSRINRRPPVLNQIKNMSWLCDIGKYRIVVRRNNIISYHDETCNIHPCLARLCWWWKQKIKVESQKCQLHTTYSTGTISKCFWYSLALAQNESHSENH